MISPGCPSRAILGFLAVIAELEREIIRETMLENRVARGRKGIPTAGSFPFGRKFNKETSKWELDDTLADLVRQVADDYLEKGKSLHDLSVEHGKLPSYKNLIHLLRDTSGDTWTVNFKDEEPITYTIPRILDDGTIQRIRERLEFNRINNRRDVPKYPLTGFIRCEACLKSLCGQTQKRRQREFKYYNHTCGKHEKCKAFCSIPMEPIENAVFRTIFENTVDAPAFEQAIAESLPDERLIKSLENKVKAGEKELRRTEKELDKLVDLALSGALQKETIKSKETSLLKAKEKITEELEETRDKLRSMPDLARVKQEAEAIRRELLERYGSEKRLQAMSFDDKQRLLHWLFDGKDRDGKHYGIYISTKGKGPKKKIDYFLYGRITGLRTLKGGDINYQSWDEDEDEYKTNSAVKNRRPQISRSPVPALAAGQSGNLAHPSPSKEGSFNLGDAMVAAAYQSPSAAGVLQSRP